jgi:integrase
MRMKTVARRRANGEGSVYQRKDGRWAASLTLPRGKRKHFLGHTRDEVSRKLTGALADQQKGVPVISNNQSVSIYLSHWLESIKSSVRPRTYDSYDLNVRRLQPLIGRTRLNSLSPAIVERAYGEGLSKRSVVHAHTVLHNALKKAVQWGLLGRNPTEAVSVPRAEQTEMKTLNEEQVRALFEVTAADRLHALYVLLATTGLRLGEATGLRWQDVDMAKGTVTVRRALQRQRGAGLVFVEPKTKTSRRNVYLANGAVEALSGHRKRQLVERLLTGADWKGLDLVFCRTDGGPLEPSGVPQRLHTILKNAGLPDLRVHDLRHTAATLQLEKGTHPKIVQEMLGHSSIALTLDVYSHVTPGLHAEAAKKMDSLFKPVVVVATSAT